MRRNEARPLETAGFLRAIGFRETLVSRIRPDTRLTERQICMSIGSPLTITSKEAHATLSFTVVIKRLRIERDAPSPQMPERKWYTRPFYHQSLTAGLVAEAQVTEAFTDLLPQPRDCIIYFKLIDTAYMDYGPGHEDGSNYGDVDYLYLQYPNAMVIRHGLSTPE